MNLDYKVVYSKTKNCYIVVSEIAKRHGKENLHVHALPLF